MESNFLGDVLNCKLEYKSDVGRKQQTSDCAILGDRGYLFQSIQLDLFQKANIKLDFSPVYHPCAKNGIESMTTLSLNQKKHIRETLR